jgi:hypothetical protein
MHTYIPLTLSPRRGSGGISDILRVQNYLAMRNTTDETGRKPSLIASQVGMLLILYLFIVEHPPLSDIFM